MTVASPDAPAHVTGTRSRDAAVARDEDAWLALDADGKIAALRTYRELDRAAASATPV